MRMASILVKNAGNKRTRSTRKIQKATAVFYDHKMILLKVKHTQIKMDGPGFRRPRRTGKTL